MTLVLLGGRASSGQLASVVMILQVVRDSEFDGDGVHTASGSI